MTDPIRIPIDYGPDCQTSHHMKITPEIARQIVALALADVCHPLNEHERRLDVIEARLGMRLPVTPQTITMPPTHWWQRGMIVRRYGHR